MAMKKPQKVDWSPIPIERIRFHCETFRQAIRSDFAASLQELCPTSANNLAKRQLTGTQWHQSLGTAVAKSQW